MNKTNNTDINTDELNNLELLQKIADCVALTAGPVGSSLSVGIYEDAALIKLKNTIIRGIQDKKITPEEEQTNKNIKNVSNGIDKIIKHHTEYDVKGILKQLSDDLKNSDKGPFKVIKDLYDNALKEAPKTRAVLHAILAVGKTQLNHGAKQVEVYKNLVNSGVNLQQTTKSLYLNANKVGLTYDNYIKVLQKNSETYAKLNGIYKNGHTVFDKMVRSAKDVTKELGLDFSTSIKISNDFMKENAFYYEMHGKSMETLIDESKSYAKSLVGLSKATGKSTESIYSEIKAREKDNLWRVLNADPRNKGLIAAMQASGFSTEMMEGILTGTWNVELGQASTAPGFSKIIEYLRNIKSQGLDLDSKEILKGMKGALTPYASDISIMEKMMRENLPVTAALRDFGGITGNLISTNILQSNFQKGNEKDQKGFQQYANFEEQLDILSNNIALTLTPALDDFGNAISLATFALKPFNKIGEPGANALSNHPYLTLIGTTIGMGFGNYFLGKIIGKSGKLLSNIIGKLSGKSVAKEIIKGLKVNSPKQKAYKEFLKNSEYKNLSRTNKKLKFNELNNDNYIKYGKIGKGIGKALGLAGTALYVAPEVIDYTNNYDKRKKEGTLRKHTVETGSKVAGGLTGGLTGTWAGAAVGAKAGASIGTLFGPGIGTAIGAGLGAVAGGLAGGLTGTWIGEKLGLTGGKKINQILDKKQKINEEQKNIKHLENINNSVKTYCNISNSSVLKTIVDINKNLLLNVKMINFHVTKLSEYFDKENKFNDEKRKIFNQSFGNINDSINKYSLNNPEFLIRQFKNTMGKGIDMEKMKTFSDVVGINSYNKFERTLEKMNEIMTKQEKSNKDISYYLQSIDANTNSTAKSTKKYANEGINLDVYDF